MHRKMGIDYGDKRIGIALTDALCIISSPFEVYKNAGREESLKHLERKNSNFSLTGKMLSTSI